MTKEKIQEIMDAVKHAEFHAILTATENEEEIKVIERNKRKGWEEVIIAILQEEMETGET